MDWSKRAVACVHWEWLPGMLSQGWNSRRVVHSLASKEKLAEVMKDHVPDFEDDATKLLLLALLWKAWGPEDYARAGIEYDPNNLDAARAWVEAYLVELDREANDIAREWEE